MIYFGVFFPMFPTMFYRRGSFLYHLLPNKAMKEGGKGRTKEKKQI